MRFVTNLSSGSALLPRRCRLQSPHDPDVTYSGHKGKGYEVQVAETCHEENATQLITHVEVTPSSWERHRRERAGR